MLNDLSNGVIQIYVMTTMHMKRNVSQENSLKKHSSVLDNLSHSYDIHNYLTVNSEAIEKCKRFK